MYIIKEGKMAYKKGTICINHVRKLLNSIWEKVAKNGVRGRCSGFKNNGKNSLYGSHITFITPTEAVTVYEGSDGFILLQFKITKSTSLGMEITELLKKITYQLKALKGFSYFLNSLINCLSSFFKIIFKILAINR
jgi:hypothetical protein